MKSVRSWHFVPSHRTGYLEKALSLAADALVFDLEDGVPAAEKEAGRRNLRRCLGRLKSKDRSRSYVRVNSDEREFRKDLRLLQDVDPAGVVLPKVEDALALGPRMRAINRGSPQRARVVLIESFRGLANLAAILDAWPLSAVGLGLEDMFAEIDIRREEAVDLAKHVQLRFVVEAKARGLASIDTVSLEYENLAAFARECAETRSLGFDGKFSIHPSQIEAINAAFSLRRRDILWARRIARLTSMRNGSGYSKRGNDVVSPPKVRKARRILGRG